MHDPKTYLGEDDFVVVHHRNIVITYHVKNKLIDLADLLRSIRKILVEIKDKLDLSPEALEIEIFKSRDEWIERHTMINEVDTPSWVMGDSGRVIRLVMDDHKIASFEDLKLMVAHECVHAIVRSHTHELCPAWLDEGLAVCMTQNLPEKYRISLQNALAADALLPIETISQSFSRLDRRLKTLAYAQSYSLVDYMADKYGWEIVREMLDDYARGDSGEAVLRERGVNMYLLEKDCFR